MRHLKFWGTRGSCSVSGPEYVHFGGNTCCLEVRYDDHIIIIDAGTGIRPLGHTILKEKNIDLFLSHMHWDHVIGFPFFEPLYMKGVKINIWAPESPDRSCHELIDDLLSKEFFPIHLDEIRAHLEFKVIHEKQPLQIGPITLDFHRVHHPGLTLSFKIKTPFQTIGYITDNEIFIESQRGLIEFYKGCDVFIHEAQYTPQEYQRKTGWGHSPIGKSIELINAIRPGLWLVSHHDPDHTDADLLALEKHAKSSSLPCPVDWVSDGYEFPLK